MAATASVRLEEGLPFGDEPVGRCAAREPGGVVRPAHHRHAADHRRMVGAAILRAEQAVGSGLGGAEPERLISARQNVVLDPEGRDRKIVDHILGCHQQLNCAIDRNMQLVDLVLTARMLDFPHPLLADDIDLHRLGGSLKQAHVEIRAPQEQAEKHEERGDRPGGLDPPRLLRQDPAIQRAACAIADHVGQHQPENERKDGEAHQQQAQEQRVAFGRLRRGLRQYQPQGRFLPGRSSSICTLRCNPLSVVAARGVP